MQIGNDLLLSTRATIPCGQGPEIRQHAFGTSSRPSQNLEPAISHTIQVPEQKQRVYEIIQPNRLARSARGILDLLVLPRNYVEELWVQRLVESGRGRIETYPESSLSEIYNSVVDYSQPFQP